MIRKVASVIGVFVLTAGLALMPVTAASAQTGPTPPPPTDPPVTGLSSDGSTATPPKGGASTQAVQTGIAPGCSGALDYVHRSGGTASVHGRTSCAQSSRNYISLSIGYIGWFGERYAVSGNDATAINGQTASGQAKSVCSGTGEQTWRAFGYHSAIVGGTTYYGNTSQDGRFTC